MQATDLTPLLVRCSHLQMAHERRCAAFLDRASRTCLGWSFRFRPAGPRDILGLGNHLGEGRGDGHGGATGDNEVTILARVFDDERGLLPPELARSIIDVEFSERDKARMHDLVVRNQADTLTSAEKEELHAFAKAGTLLGILKSKARQTLKIKPKRRNRS